MPTDKTSPKYDGKTVSVIMLKRQPPLSEGERCGFSFEHAVKLVDQEIARPAYPAQWEAAKKAHASKKASASLPSQEDFVAEEKPGKGK